MIEMTECQALLIWFLLCEVLVGVLLYMVLGARKPK